MKGNGSRRRRAPAATLDIAVAHAGGGRMELVSRYFFANPQPGICRRLVGRLFEVEEVRAVEILASRATARIEYTNGTVPWRDVVGKIARHLRNGDHPARPPYVNSPQDLPGAVDGADGWRVERHGALLSTWEITHELPGRIRFRNRLIRRNGKACRAIERAVLRAIGVSRCTTSPHTASALIVFEPRKVQRDDLIRILDRALIDAERPELPEPAVRSDSSRASRPAPGSVAISELRWSSQAFMISSLSLVMAGPGALLYPPLGPLSVPAHLYIFRHLYAHGVRFLVRERKLTVDILVTALGLAALLHGYFFIFSLGNFLYLCTKNLLDKVKQDSRADYTDIFRQQARTAWVRIGGVEIETPLEAVTVGDVVAIAAGQTIPVDGRIAEGTATIDQHLMTGEAIPAEKGVGDPVLALTVVLSGKIYVRVEKTGAATAAAHIASVLDRTVDFKTGRQLRAERLADQLVGPALVAGLLAWPVLGVSAGAAVVDAHPKYKTTLASSLGLLNYFKIAARHGLLIKDGRTLELLNDVDTVVFDKTGTLTLAQPHVRRLYSGSAYSADDVLRLAAACEQHQSHPLATAIVHAARGRGLSIPSTTAADYRIGYGLTVMIDGAAIRVGSMRFIEEAGIVVPPAVADIQARCHRDGQSLVLVAVDAALAGAIELHTTVRPEARRIVRGLRERNITSMYIISGDHEAPTRRLAKSLEIEHYFAETLPENKALVIERLAQAGKVICYVGDGINDSIAMKKSHVSVSLRGASTVATDTAEVILLDESLNQLCTLVDLARECNRNMRLTMGAVFLPSLICLGGVLLGQFSFLESRLLNYVGLGGGVGAAMLPLLTHRTAPARTAVELSAGSPLDGRIEEHVIA